MESENFVVCIVDRDYEIEIESPHRIRRINGDRFIAETINNKNGYIYCKLNGKSYRKHRIIALQFIPNPENKPEVDHINGDKTDNRIENLRWATRSENNSNKKPYKKQKIQYVEELPADYIAIDRYNNHQFEDYYYSPSEDKFYHDDGYFARIICTNTGNGYERFNARDINGINRMISVQKLKKIYGFD